MFEGVDAEIDQNKMRIDVVWADADDRVFAVARSNNHERCGVEAGGGGVFSSGDAVSKHYVKSHNFCRTTTFICKWSSPSYLLNQSFHVVRHCRCTGIVHHFNSMPGDHDNQRCKN